MRRIAPVAALAAIASGLAFVGVQAWRGVASTPESVAIEFLRAQLRGDELQAYRLIDPAIRDEYTLDRFLTRPHLPVRHRDANTWSDVRASREIVRDPTLADRFFGQTTRHIGDRVQVEVDYREPDTMKLHRLGLPLREDVEVAQKPFPLAALRDTRTWIAVVRRDGRWWVAVDPEEDRVDRINSLVFDVVVTPDIDLDIELARQLCGEHWPALHDYVRQECSDRL